MKFQYLDVVIAKKFEFRADGKTETKRTWNKVGKAWASKNGEAMNLELFMFPNQMYSIPYNSKNQNEEVPK